MKTGSFFAAGLLVLLLVPHAYAELDLDKEVLVIPDTHNEKPYIWNVRTNPREYELIIEAGKVTAGKKHDFRFSVSSKEAGEIISPHVFITDDDLHEYAHIIPEKANGAYLFSYQAPKAGRYRFEIVFQSSKGWVNLRKDIKISGDDKAPEPAKISGDEDYQIKVRLIPPKAYAEHVVTLLYDISYKGAPLTDIEKVDGFDMHAAAWDEDLREFLYITPKQNLGGPEVPVNIVFMRPGRHAVFAEFRHKGVVRKVEFVLSVAAEPKNDPGSIERLMPADY
ncbi:MAG: hypothetical protein HZB33_14930 [Nitrospirae bacterium]|nr:hypothetical protein [Nitrospirota bacterium]